MENISPKLHPDPEVEALLHFPPVLRRCVRHDGWLPDRQREFIIALTVLGQAEQSAIAVGGTMSGAYKLRTADGGEGFADAWDAALALHHRRHPRPEPKGRPSRGEIRSGAGRQPWPRAGAQPAPPPEPPTDPEAEYQEFVDKILRKYWLKLDRERKARLEGRIVEADFIVRQLTWLEVGLDLTEQGIAVLDKLKRGKIEVGNIVATPVSLLLDRVRRAYWAEKDEPERPPLAPLGRMRGEAAIGETPHWEVEPGVSDREHRRREDAKAALHAEAQRLWEEKARAEAEAWAKRSAEGRN